MRKIFLVLAALSITLSVSGLARAKDKPESKTAAMVELFLKTPDSQLPADEVDDFLVIDPKTLPKKLRDPYEAKKLELESLRKAYEVANDGPGKDGPSPKGCSAVVEGDESLVSMLESGGFMEITGTETQWLVQNTRCKQSELMCEFTLTIIHRKGSKKMKAKTWYLLHGKDPLAMLVGMNRQGQAPSGGGSFGESNFPTCR